jgi:hypothetical protein
MNRKFVVLALGIITFIVGFALLVFVSWWLIGVSGLENVVGEQFRTGTVATGSISLVGLALEAIGIIVILFAKFEK